MPQKVEPGSADSTSSLPSSPDIAKALELIGKVLAPTTVVSALLFYFGWDGTNALYLSFGIDQSVLGFSTQDYLLRSIVVAFEPLRWMLLLALGGAWSHFAISRWRTQRSRLFTFVTNLTLLIGIGSLLAGPIAVWISAQRHTPVAPIFYPLAWTLGVGLTSYGVFLLAQRRNIRDQNGQAVPLASIVPAGLSRISWWAVVGLLILGLFWSVAAYADIVGQWRARQLIAHLDDAPDVIVYSQEPLGLENSGAVVAQISSVENSFQFRYTGLKFLVRASSKYFLLPANWSSANRVAIILPDSATIRVEVGPGASLMP